MTVAVQRVLDDASETLVDPATRLIEADVAAAELASQAAALVDEAGLTPDPEMMKRLERRCEELQTTFGDVVRRSVWATVPGTAHAPDPTALTTPPTVPVTSGAAEPPTGDIATETTAVAAPLWTCEIGHKPR